MKRALASGGGVAGLDAKMTEDIQRAIEIMRRVRVANAEQAEKALKAIKGNIYVLPPPLTLRTGSSA